LTWHRRASGWAEAHRPPLQLAIEQLAALAERPPIRSVPVNSPPEIPGVRHDFLDVAGLRTHVALAGREGARTVMLVHGWPQKWWAWRELIPTLAKRFRVIAPDLRGHGWTGLTHRRSAGRRAGKRRSRSVSSARRQAHTGRWRGRRATGRFRRPDESRDGLWRRLVALTRCRRSGPPQLLASGFLLALEHLGREMGAGPGRHLPLNELSEPVP
jgi:hypothetical protein